uniref:Uncharacterized protein n=1 Tax=Lepeophtheirus salmonis TaxID=72036 RepID=A0A0K2T415_LEPSM
MRKCENIFFENRKTKKRLINNSYYYLQMAIFFLFCFIKKLNMK